ncbi:MAG: hypothetical protein ACJ76F_14650 [Bacteroidia bacterium]
MKIILNSSAMLLLLLVSAFTGDERKTVYAKNGIEISYVKSECKLDNSFNQSWFLLRVKNTTSKKVTLSWKVDLYNQNNACVNCNAQNDEDVYSVSLLPGEIREGNCDFKCPPALRIVSQLLDVETKDHYPSFKLENITITE